MPKLLDLFLTFLRIGAFTFGGGYVMIPLIQSAVSDKKGWITHDEILEIVAIAESTPGPLAINTATFVGYRIGGVIGAFLATLAVVLPSFIIIVLIATLLSAFQDNQYVTYAFMGVRAGVLALIVKAVYSMTIKAKDKNVIFFIIMGLSFAVVVFFRVNVLLVIVASGIIGLASFFIAGGMKNKKSNAECSEVNRHSEQSNESEAKDISALSQHDKPLQSLKEENEEENDK